MPGAVLRVRQREPQRDVLFELEKLVCVHFTLPADAGGALPRELSAVVAVGFEQLQHDPLRDEESERMVRATGCRVLVPFSPTERYGVVLSWHALSMVRARVALLTLPCARLLSCQL